MSPVIVFEPKNNPIFGSKYNNKRDTISNKE